MSTERIAVYPGTFDPITNGHHDVIKRAAVLFDELVVAVAINDQKSPTLGLDLRLELIRSACSDIDNVSVLAFSGLVVELADRPVVVVKAHGGAWSGNERKKKEKARRKAEKKRRKLEKKRLQEANSKDRAASGPEGDGG